MHPAGREFHLHCLDNSCFILHICAFLWLWQCTWGLAMPWVLCHGLEKMNERAEKVWRVEFHPSFKEFRLHVGSSIYIVVSKAVFSSSYLCILMTLTMSLGPGHTLDAMSRIGEDGRESWASFVSGVSS